MLLVSIVWLVGLFSFMQAYIDSWPGPWPWQLYRDIVWVHVLHNNSFIKIGKSSPITISTTHNYNLYNDILIAIVSTMSNLIHNTEDMNTL